MPFKKIFLLSVLIFALASGALADFGNWFAANQRLSNPLNTPDQKLSFRFTCQHDIDLTAASVYCVDAVAPPAYLVSVQADNAGVPSGVPLAVVSYVPAAKSWSTLPIASVLLTQGKVYDLVIEDDVKRGGSHPVGVIGSSHYASFLSTDVLNHLHANDGTSDPASNVLLFDGHQWKKLNREPVYAIYGAGAQAQGNPYDSPGVCPIYGDGSPNDTSHQVLQGEALHFHCGFFASGFAIRVRKEGNPRAPLNYLIIKNLYEKHQFVTIYKGVALNPDQVSSHFQWVTIGFTDEKQGHGFSDECWPIALQTNAGQASSDSPGCQDCYVLSSVGNSGGLAGAANLTFDGGPHLSRWVHSVDGGSPLNWLEGFESDANLVAIGPTCPPPVENSFPPLPTPLPLVLNAGSRP